MNNESILPSNGQPEEELYTDQVNSIGGGKPAVISFLTSCFETSTNWELGAVREGFELRRDWGGRRKILIDWNCLAPRPLSIVNNT